MSLGEILVIGLVALFVTKPEDLPVIFAKIKQIKAYFDRIKDDIYKAIEPNLIKIEEDSLQDIALMNDYLKKIITINGDYQGEYSLTAVKLKYAQLLIEKQKDEDQIT